MANEQDEDALFDRLAKSLDAVRQDAELARSGGTEGFAAGLARLEAELHGQGAGVEALRQRLEQQRAVIARLDAAADKSAADTEALRQTVEALSRRVREQAESLSAPPPRRWSPGVLAGVVIVLVALALAGAAAAWIGSGREPTPGALAHRFVARLSELIGINPTGPARPAGRTVALVAANPEPAPPPRQSAAPKLSAAAPAASTSPPAAVAAPQELPAAAPPPPAAMPPPAAAALTATTPPSQAAPAAVTPPSDQQANPAPPTPATPIPAVASPVAPAQPPPPIATPPRQPPPTRHLVLRATADSWVEVRQTDGHVLLRRLMRAGDSWPVPDQPGLLLASGNAGALEVQADGLPPTRLAGIKGGVVRDVPLDADLLGAGPPPRDRRRAASPQ